MLILHNLCFEVKASKQLVRLMLCTFNSVLSHNETALRVVIMFNAHIHYHGTLGDTNNIIVRFYPNALSSPPLVLLPYCKVVAMAPRLITPHALPLMELKLINIIA